MTHSARKYYSLGNLRPVRTCSEYSSNHLANLVMAKSN